MKLTDMTITDFTNVLASSAPAPGGGSAAALEGALGIALAHMVAALTVGKKKYAEHDAFLTEQMAKAQAVQHTFVDVIERDTQAFNQVSAVFAMPKVTDEDKAARKQAMQQALKASTLTPYEMMTSAMEALELTNSLMGKSNVNAASDLGVAALSLKAAVQGAWLNILINLGGIEDQTFVSRYRAQGEAILEKALPMADSIYETVRKSL